MLPAMLALSFLSIEGDAIVLRLADLVPAEIVQTTQLRVIVGGTRDDLRGPGPHRFSGGKGTLVPVVELGAVVLPELLGLHARVLAVVHEHPRPDLQLGGLLGLAAKRGDILERDVVEAVMPLVPFPKLHI